MDSEIIIKEVAPDLNSFIEFRSKCGWGEISTEVALMSLANSDYCLSAWRVEELAGFVRVVGDGALYFYVQDLIVRDDLRGLGIGRSLMMKVMSHLRGRVPAEGTVALLSAVGKEEFYESFGFVRRPNAIFGAGMIYVPQAN